MEIGRKKEDKGKEVVEIGRTHSYHEVEPQRGAKQPIGMQTRLANEAERTGEHQVATPAWTPPLELDRAPLSSDVSIRDFQGGTAGNVANAVEQSLLLPKDMADLKSMRKHEIFLVLKRDLAMVSFLLHLFFFFITSFPWQAIQAAFRAEEMVSSSHSMYKEEEGRQIAAVEAFQVAEKSN